ncbi:hypothetical protein [Metallosphaera javensis (ex Sakai et al. 2022)]|uniref:hypothetical protein n=1 Tax=Metallosphaera javensis (ex Sakai et al. 2022) TaxID=2775498 RepID=UPI00258A9715|nr:MAG: hypothetical protein MjAS7_1574 [Metallosphaera javensis (ex Sakai et al. 2022)]
MRKVDRDLLALLGEAGATGLAKGIYEVRREERFRHAYEDELSHWKFFRSRKRSRLELPVYYALLLFGILIGTLGMSVTRRVINYLERGAIDFYVKNYPNDERIMEIVEEERKHFL